MLKEIVTSIFCCLPHHHEAPVVAERITPITIVSQEPYSYGALMKAVNDRDYQLVIELWARGVQCNQGQWVLDELDKYCEQFVHEVSSAQTSYDCTSLLSSLRGELIVSKHTINELILFDALNKLALQTEDIGDCIKALYWWSLTERIHGYHGDEGEKLMKVIQRKKNG